MRWWAGGGLFNHATARFVWVAGAFEWKPLSGMGFPRQLPGGAELGREDRGGGKIWIATGNPEKPTRKIVDRKDEGK